MREEWQGDAEEGAGERVSLDQRSKFTLTRFRRSKYTQMFAWLITLFSWTS
ncbi:hypothetical protein [Aestuariivirga litoralis]|uniref:hypothetical protein n=1 Tax=Aestuariivirga litoralis TaxID=2650924 RepID=UPI0018C70A5F|nr:hypothetical protein [Aestuariivirga litoralis]